MVRWKRMIDVAASSWSARPFLEVAHVLSGDMRSRRYPAGAFSSNLHRGVTLAEQATAY